MNGWPAEITKLTECGAPRARLVTEVAETGSRPAKIQFAARGLVAHHDTNLGRDAVQSRPS